MPAKRKVEDEELLSLIRKGFTVAKIVRAVGLSSSGNHLRIHKLASKHGLEVAREVNGAKTAEANAAEAAFQEKLRHNARKHINVTNGVVLVGSDAHYWPGIRSTAHRAFCKFAADLKPSAVILNGDAFDGGSISRFPRIGWDSKPTVQQELEACRTFMSEIEEASRTKNLYWPLGNHDSRFETFLASKAPEFQGVDGFHLKDHFPLWIPCWSVWINDSVVVKHRMRSGLHAPHNNTMWAGKSIVTGHLHSLKTMPISDYNGTRFGVDCGTMAEVGGPQFVDYLEDSATNWRSGFAVLTFWNGRLLWPELAHVIEDGKVEFRGQVVSV
jgi:hypothetical protein